MTDEKWSELLELFDENEKRLSKMKPAGPKSFKFWRQSAHGTLGHLTACQAAWLPVMRMLRNGAAKGSAPIRPDPLYTKLGFSTKTWKAILLQYRQDRAEWRKLLTRIDPTQQIKTPSAMHTAQTLTKRLVTHEKHHLDTLEDGA